MTIRTTQGLANAQIQRALTSSFSRLTNSQLRIATGRRFSRASEAPGEAARLLFFKQRARELDQFQSNIDEGKAFILSANDTLQGASDLLISAREQIIQGLSETISETDRETIGNAIGQKLEELIALANSRLGNRQLFSGTATDAQSFVLKKDSSGQEFIEYQGNDDSIVAEVGPGISSSINLPGSRIFLRDSRGATRFDGTTGAAVGSGTDSGRGVDRLLVQHSSTTITGGGLAPGASSVGGDTVIGSHSLTLNVDPTGSSGTISLNGGPPVSFTNPDTDVQVTGPNGEVVFLDTTSVTPGFSNTVPLTADGTLSTDGGTTTTPIDFSANQQVRDSASGAILNVDTTNIARAGEEVVSYTDTMDAFSALIAIRDIFTGKDKSTSGDDLERARSYLNELDASHDQLLQSLGRLGEQEARLSTSGNRLADVELRVQDLVSRTEDIDISQAVIDLEQSEASYQSALLVTSRVNQLSLLNFI